MGGLEKLSEINVTIPAPNVSNPAKPPSSKAPIKDSSYNEDIGLIKMHEKFMRAAIREAKKACSIGDVPIGCVIVKEGHIIARGYNRRTADSNTISHAEITAIKKACKKTGDWRLEECELYVTLEPCPMCAGAIIQARIPKIYIGAMNPKAGCAGSVTDLFETAGFNHHVEKRIGICQEECSNLLKEFFRELRKAHPEKIKYIPEKSI